MLPTNPATPSVPGFSRARWMCLASVLTAAAVLAGAEWAARRYLVAFEEAIGKPFERAEHVQFLKSEVASTQPPPARPELLLVGNSHTFGLPGLKSGDFLQLESGPVVLDALAADLREQRPDLHPECVLLAYPNFLPYEMLVRVSHLLHKGHKPRIAIIGVTVRNLVRDSQLRETVRETFKDPAAAEELKNWLYSPEAGETGEIRAEFQADQNRIAAQLEADRTRSAADRWDDQLTNWVQARLALLGSSVTLRGNLLMDYWIPLQTIFFQTDVESITTQVVERDYRFNRQCLSALLRLLRQNHVTVVCYYPPERPDMPLMVDVRQQEQFMREFQAEADVLEVPVLDARRIVPANEWGWTNYTRDRSHFLQAGHQRLADFLMRELADRHLWNALTTP